MIYRVKEIYRANVGSRIFVNVKLSVYRCTDKLVFNVEGISVGDTRD